VLKARRAFRVSGREVFWGGYQRAVNRHNHQSQWLLSRYYHRSGRTATLTRSTGMGGTCQLIIREGIPPVTSSCTGGTCSFLFPVEDTIFTNNVFGVLIDNIHHIYQLCIKCRLELDYGLVNRIYHRRCLKRASQSATSSADSLRSPGWLVGLFCGSSTNWRAKSLDEITLARAWRAKPCTWLSELTTI
jgi:hypothetical protein